jgi:hypothetical protein
VVAVYQRMPAVLTPSATQYLAVLDCRRCCGRSHARAHPAPAPAGPLLPPWLPPRRIASCRAFWNPNYASGSVPLRPPLQLLTSRDGCRDAVRLMLPRCCSHTPPPPPPPPPGMEQRGGYAALRRHPFFRSFDWQALRDQRLPAPHWRAPPAPLPQQTKPQRQHPAPVIEE